MNEQDVVQYSLNHYGQAEWWLKMAVAERPDEETAIVTMYASQLQHDLALKGRPDVKVLVDADRVFVFVREDAVLELSPTQGITIPWEFADD